MTQLEHQLGFPLFERIGRKNRMTPPARELAQTVKSCFTPVDELVARLRGDHVEMRGVVRIGGPPPFSRLWLRPRLTELKKRYPEILPEVQFDMAWVLSPRLVAGESTCAFWSAPSRPTWGSSRSASTPRSSSPSPRPAT